MSRIFIQIIKLYQYFSRGIVRYNALPLVFFSGCRYYPTCSDYTIEAIQRDGFLKGIWKGLIRVIKCNPLVTNR